MGFVISRIHFGLRLVFCFRHITAFHYHHCARQLTGTEYIYMFVEYLVEVCLTCCWSYRLPFNFITYIWDCMCSTGPFQYRWLKGYIYSSCYYHNQIGSIHLSHCYHIFPWLWCLLHHILHLLHIRSGETGNLFSSLLCSLRWVQIVGYVFLADRTRLFVQYTIS